jgi:hypothetical protein
MKYVSIVSGVFLLAVAFFSWGFVAGEYKVFPWSKIDPVRNEIAAYVQGGGANRKTIREKIANDAGLRPERMLAKFAIDGSRDYKPVKVEGLKQRRMQPLMYFSGEQPFSSGYLLVWGCFDFEDHMQGGVLLNNQGEVVHRWMPHEQSIRAAVEDYNQGERG